jgi:hypothetical protein
MYSRYIHGPLIHIEWTTSIRPNRTQGSNPDHCLDHQWLTPLQPPRRSDTVVPVAIAAVPVLALPSYDSVHKTLVLGMLNVAENMVSMVGGITVSRDGCVVGRRRNATPPRGTSSVTNSLSPAVGPCSQMLYIKNKTTQLLIISDLRLLKHYLLLDIMIFRRRL